MKIPNKNYLVALLQKMIAVKIFDQGHNKPTKKVLGMSQFLKGYKDNMQKIVFKYKNKLQFRRTGLHK